MKVILYILVLANLGFFGWASFYAEQPQHIGRLAAAGPGLTLASEVDTNELDAPQTGSNDIQQSREPYETLVRNRCWSLGPFAEVEEAETAIAALNNRGLTPIQREAEQDIWVGYWVHLPAFPNYQEAEAVGLDLRAQGVNDIYVEPNGELANTVSLGVFKEKDRAHRRIQELIQKGVDAQLGNRYRPGKVHWIDFGQSEQAPVTPADFPTKPGRILRLQAYGC